MRDPDQINLFGPDFRTNPYPVYAFLRDHTPVYRRANVSDGSATCFVTRYEDAVQVLRDHTLYVKDIRQTTAGAYSPTAGNSEQEMSPLQQHMLNMDGDHHRRLRALVNKAFTPRMVEQMRGRFETLATTLLDAVVDCGEMDLIQGFALPFPMAVISELLGIPGQDQHRLHGWSSLLTSPVPAGVRRRRRAARIQQLSDEYTRYMAALFAKRRAEPQGDLISSLLVAEDAGEMLTEDELYSMVLLLIVVGHETSVNLIGNGMLALLDHPEQREELVANPELLPTAIEEMLRFDCPVERAPMRFANADHILNGTQVRRGDAVSVVLGSANRDPALFPEPDRFDISRTDNRHIAFGHGIHYCIGAALARLEGQLALRMLLRRLPKCKLAIPREQLRWGTNPIMRGVRSLPIIWSP